MPETPSRQQRRAFARKITWEKFSFASAPADDHGIISRPVRREMSIDMFHRQKLWLKEKQDANNV